MRNLTILFILIGLPLLGEAKTTFTKEQLKEKTDSILAEGNLLYQYERAAWVSNDLAWENKSIANNFAGYLVYQENDTIKSIILNKDNQCIYVYSFLNDFSKPSKEQAITRELSENERTLLSVRKYILKQINENKFGVSCPAGFSLNLDLIPFERGYKFYIITGTTQSQIIPFGNDYLFKANSDGEILSMRKFHSRLIPTMTQGPSGEQITGLSHSHLKNTPFITATDICTFKLYGSLYGLSEFSVYSPALSVSFTYNMDLDEIEIKDEL